MDWMVFPWTDDINSYVDALWKPVDCIVLGRKLAEGFIPTWESRPETEDDATIDTMINTPKVVVTNSVTVSPWNNTVVAGGDLTKIINGLKAQSGGDMIVCGSGTPRTGVDRTGIARRTPPVRQPRRSRRRDAGVSQPRNQLDLIKSQAFDCGITALHYEPKRSPAAS